MEAEREVDGERLEEEVVFAADELGLAGEVAGEPKWRRGRWGGNVEAEGAPRAGRRAPAGKRRGVHGRVANRGRILDAAQPTAA